MKKTISIILCTCLLGGIAVAFQGCAATGTRESTGEFIDDAAITAKVKTALLRDDIVKGLDVKVETFRGSVQLSGFVDNVTQQQHAEDIARATPGVVEVVNNTQLKVRPIPAP
jgi:osmotically-inducible protein OsmY